MPSPFPSSPVIRECSWKKTPIEKKINKKKFKKIKFTDSFQSSMTFYIETSHLICSANQAAGFYKQCNTSIKLVEIIYTVFITSFDFLQSLIKNGRLFLELISERHHWTNSFLDEWQHKFLSLINPNPKK